MSDLSDVPGVPAESMFARDDDEVRPLGKESITSRLRKAAQEAADDKTTDIDIPGYNGELFCRYRLLTGEELDNIVKKNREDSPRSEQLRNVTLDNLITSCQEFWLREEGKEIPIRQHPEYDGDRDVAVRYDASLAGFLACNLREPSARQVVLAVFGNNDIAVSAHAARVSTWMMKGGNELAGLLGGY